MKRFKLLIITILILLALFFLNYFGAINFIKDTFQKVLTPVQETIFNTGFKVKSFFWSPTSPELKQENQELKKNLKQCLIDSSEFEILKQENEFLKKELNFQETSNLNYQVAKIIARESIFGKKVIILNKGEASGIKAGYPVIISAEQKNKGYLIGKIIETDENTSKLVLITDSKSTVAAKILGGDTTSGIVRGEKGLTLKMELVPTENQIQPSNIIITSGLEQNIPEGLIIGEIEQILSDPGDFFGQAKIKSFVDFDNLKIVTILLPQ